MNEKDTDLLIARVNSFEKRIREYILPLQIPMQARFRRCKDPVYFKETDGRWLPWAVKKSLDLYDSFGGNASITLKCPKLRIRVKRSSKEVAKLRGSHEGLFPVVRDIDQLLSRGFNFDPWSKVIRRGEISAGKGKL